MKSILYHTSGCRHTPWIKGIIGHLKVDCSFREISAKSLRELPGAIYKESPIFVDESVVVEDWRLITRHIIESFDKDCLGTSSPHLRCEVMDLCELIDGSLLGPAQAFGDKIPSYFSLLKWLLAPITQHGRSRTKVHGTASYQSLMNTLLQLSADPRLHAVEFYIPRFMLEAGKERLRKAMP